MKLWYKQPAGIWNEALPSGNGRIGAMVYGRTIEEIISLNEDTLWSGYPRNTLRMGADEAIKQAEELVSHNQFAEAGEILDKYVLGEYSQGYLPFGDLKLNFLGVDEKNINLYERELDLNTALQRVSFISNGIKYKREIFVSEPDQVLVIKLMTSEAQKLNMEMGFSCQLKHSVSTEDHVVSLSGVAPSFVYPSYYKPEIEEPAIYEEDDAKKGMRFYGEAVIASTDGTVENGETSLMVSCASNIEIRLFLGTSYSGFDKLPYLEGMDEVAKVKKQKYTCESISYEQLKQRHTQDYYLYYKRVELSLAQTDKEENIATDERMIRFQKTQQDPFLYELLFEYGRYLMISSSRKGTQATNLQGIWNHLLRPSWSSNYTLNINTEMNYWPTECIGLPECHVPLFALIEKLRIVGRKTAKKYYGARGAVAWHNSDIWGLATPTGKEMSGFYSCCYWNMSFGWLTRHLFEHYEYSLDECFLRDTAYPVIKDAVEFYLDRLVENEDGYLWMLASTSPENRFLYKGENLGISKFTTMSNAIIREVFQNFLKCVEILKIDAEMREQVKFAINKLPPFKIGRYGQMLEYDEEFEEQDLHHRHISHLYALYPACEAAEYNNEKLAQACRRTLERRGDEGTGWSLAWKICAWARLGDADHALKLLKRQLQLVGDVQTENYSDGGGTYANLLCAHPPFQIDGNFGACAGICEMLVQCCNNDIYLLPALSAEIGNGYVRGLRVKNSMTLDMEFENGELKKAVLHPVSYNARRVKIHYKKSVVEKIVTHSELIISIENGIIQIN